MKTKQKAVQCNVRCSSDSQRPTELIALNDAVYFFQDRCLLVCSMWQICRLELPRRHWRSVFPTRYGPLCPAQRKKTRLKSPAGKHRTATSVENETQCSEDGCQAAGGAEMDWRNWPVVSFGQGEITPPASLPAQWGEIADDSVTVARYERTHTDVRQHSHEEDGLDYVYICYTAQEDHKTFLSLLKRMLNLLLAEKLKLRT